MLVKDGFDMYAWLCVSVHVCVCIFGQIDACL